ncbi:hypothetical protein J2T02_001270 [Chitinophaga terrae (ex Kim and Jung 2007)]|nr:hypothetical protein [Chitinophaga terrae (ex Kim and Jung 2007)]
MQKYAALSPYIYALDNPISHLDVEGAEGVNFNEGKPKPNTIIIIATEMEIKGPLSPTNTAASKAHHGQWNVILATSMIDAESQMKKYYGDSKAKNVVIHSHGTTDDKARFVFGTGEQSGRFSPEVLQAYVDNPKNEDGKGLKRLPEVHYNNAVAFNGIINMIEDKGNLVIAACHAGKGDEGNEMGKVLHEIAPNINIYLNSDYSTYHTYAGFGYGVGQTAGNPTGQLTDKSDLSGGWRKVDQNGKITNLKARSNDGNLIINTKEQPAITPSKKESSQLTKPKS